MRTIILLNGDMVITIPKEEKEQQLQHLDSLIPADQAQYDEITVLMDIVNEVKRDCQQPKSRLSTSHLKLIQGGKL